MHNRHKYFLYPRSVIGIIISKPYYKIEYSRLLIHGFGVQPGCNARQFRNTLMTL